MTHVVHALCWVLGEDPPIFSIGYAQPDSPYDSGFTLLFDDAPGPDEWVQGVDPGRWICMGCVIDGHPEIGSGLDIAREHRVADLDDDGVWQIGDKSRLEE